MIHRRGYIASLENLIMRVPGEDEKGPLRDFSEDREDGRFAGLSYPEKEILDGMESRKIFKGFQCRGAEDNLTLQVRFEGFGWGDPGSCRRFLTVVVRLLPLRVPCYEETGIKPYRPGLRCDPVSVVDNLVKG